MRTRIVRIVSAAVATAALLVLLSPVPLLVSAWVGPQALVMGVREGAPTYAVTGGFMVACVAYLVGLLVAVIGTWRGRRRARLAAVVLFAVAIMISATPVWPVIVVSWAPRDLAIGMCLAALVGLIVALLVDREEGPPLVGVGAAMAGLVGAYALVAAVMGVVDTSVPQFPRLPWVAQFEAGAVSGGPVASTAAPQDPYLASGEGSTIHNDAWMTDAYTSRGMTAPESAQVTSFFAGGDCASILWDSRGRLIAVCVSPTEVGAYVLDPVTLLPIAQRHLADRPLAGNALTNFSGGGYAILDEQDRLVTPLPGARIARYSSDLDLLDAVDLTGSMQPDEQITAALPDWSGPLWFVGQRGTVGIVDLQTGRAASRVLRDSAGGAVDIENSLAVAQGGGAYVVTSHALVRLDIVAGAPSVTWTQPYDAGTRRKPGQTSRASGTTPTVFRGGDFVAITDNAEPVMNVVVIDVRDGAPRQHCSVPVFTAAGSATENSLIAMGDSLFVENNYGYSLLDVAGGRTSMPGMARIDVTDAGCRLAWSTDEVTVPSLVSKGVALDGAVLTYTKDASALGVDAWWFTAVDATSGDVRWRRLAGIGPMLNNHYAAAYVGPTGNVYVGTVSGVVALIGG